jgi:hypothetical protein
MLEILTTALTQGRTVAFDYDDKPRVVEPHAIGTSTKDGSIIMRAYQVAGESSRPLPCWALFTVDKMVNVEISPFVLSEAPREGYKMNDKQMSSIIAQIELLTELVA